MHSNFRQITFSALGTHGILTKSPTPYSLDKEDKEIKHKCAALRQRSEHTQAALSRLSRQASPGKEGRVRPSAAQPAPREPEEAAQPEGRRDGLTDRQTDSRSPAPSQAHLTLTARPRLRSSTATLSFARLQGRPRRGACWALTFAQPQIPLCAKG